MTPISELEHRRRQAKAEEIAREVDPKAGGFAKRCMEEAALKGMAYSREELLRILEKEAASWKREGKDLNAAALGAVACELKVGSP